MLAHSAAEIHRFVAHRVPEPQDAADIAQQALLQACTKLHTVKGDNLRPWLFTIAHHLIVDHYRAKNRFEFSDVNEAKLPEQEPELQTPAEEVQTVCESRERIRCWVSCISRRLPLEEQVAVLLADLQGYRDKDSAAVMNMTEPSFKLLLHGARAHLHEASGGNCTLVPQNPDALVSGKSPQNRANGNARINGNHASRFECPLLGQASAARHESCNGYGQTGHNGEHCERCSGASQPVSTICHLGLKCCRRVPRFFAIRDRLLAALMTDSLIDLGETVETLLDWLGTLM